MSLHEKVVKELGFGMNLQDAEDVAFVAIWLSKKPDGHLSPTFCAIYEEPVPDEIKQKISDILKYYAERILEADPPTAQHGVHPTGYPRGENCTCRPTVESYKRCPVHGNASG